jgi:methylated-DNA-[protein]-cysteine S-methyltransferase
MGGPTVANSGSSKVLDTAEKQLKNFFAGKGRVLDFDVELQGTEFQRAVWAEISKIGFGETKTYGEIAQAIGRPKAVRAVGGAVGANPVPLVVGCHRVLGTSGKITGYSGGDGLPTKRWLLALEGLKAKE